MGVPTRLAEVNLRAWVLAATCGLASMARSTSGWISRVCRGDGGHACPECDGISGCGQPRGQLVCEQFFRRAPVLGDKAREFEIAVQHVRRDADGSGVPAVFTKISENIGAAEDQERRERGPPPLLVVNVNGSDL